MAPRCKDPSEANRPWHDECTREMKASCSVVLPARTVREKGGQEQTAEMYACSISDYFVRVYEHDMEGQTRFLYRQRL